MWPERDGAEVLGEQILRFDKLEEFIIDQGDPLDDGGWHTFMIKSLSSLKNLKLVKVNVD